MKKTISMLLIMIMLAFYMPSITASTNGYIEAPQISFRDNYLIITTQNDANVYYAFGGSDPKINGVLYKNPIRIETIHTEVRAIALKDGIVSEEAVAVYSTDDKFEEAKPFIFGGKDDDRLARIEAEKNGFVAVGLSYVTSFGNGDFTGATGNGLLDATIYQYDNSGNVLWYKNFGGKNNDEFRDVCITDDGYVAVGTAQSSSFGTGDFSELTSKGAQDAVIVKFDKNGTVLWVNNFGGSGSDEFDGVSAVSDGYIAVGTSRLSSFGTGDFESISSKGESDAIMVKYDTQGNKLWTKTFGGEGFDNFTNIETDGDNYIVVGDCSEESFENGDLFGVEAKGTTDAIMIKYDKNGEIIWKRNFGGRNDDYFVSVAVDETGYVAVGNNYSSDGGDWDTSSIGWTDAIIVKYDKQGNLTWRKRFGGYDSDSFYDVKAEEGGYVVAGYVGADSLTDEFGMLADLEIPSDETALVVKYDRNGEWGWVKSFPSSHQGIAVNKSGFATVGYVTTAKFKSEKLKNLTNRGSNDTIFTKYDYMPADSSYQYAVEEKGMAGVSGKETRVTEEQFSVPVYFTPQKDAVGVNMKLTYPSYISYLKNTGEYDSAYISESKSGDKKTLTISVDFSLENLTVEEDETIVFAALHFKLADDAPLGECSISVDNGETFMVDSFFTPTPFEKINDYTFEIISVPAKEIYISGEKEINGATQYHVQAFPTNAVIQNLTWSVSDETRARIDNSGVLTPLKNGAITVKVENEDSIKNEFDVTATGIKSYITTLESNVGAFEKEYTPQELNRTLYVPMNTKEVKLKATFSSGSIASDYGIFFNSIEKTILLNDLSQTIQLTKKSADCDDVVYTLTVIKNTHYIKDAFAKRLDNGTTKVSANFHYVPESVLYAAVYQGKVLRGIKIIPISKGQISESLTVDADGNTVRLFVFENAASMKPLCYPCITTVQ